MTDHGDQRSRSAGSIEPATIVAGILGILCLAWSFLNFYTASVPDIRTTLAGDAWTGFFGWAGALIAAAGGVLLLVVGLSSAAAGRMRLVGTGLLVVALVFLVVAYFVHPTVSCGNTAICERLTTELEYGVDVGYWLALGSTLLAAILAGLGLVRSRRG